MPDADRFPTVPGVEIRGVAGRGGFATVYSGFQAAFNRLVAVKVLERSELDDDARRRFDRECHVMGTLSNHPYIVTLYVAGYTVDERPYMVMPYVADGTLADRIRRSGPMPWEDVVKSGVRLAGALATAHEAGVLHRDIKPANVLRAEYGDLLGDFGIARIAGGHETKSGVITASIAHAPPEVLDGEPPDARSDVYSLGSTLFEAIAGHAAFTSSPNSVGVGPVLRRIFAEAPPPLAPDFAPSAIDEVIQRAMSKERADRFATAAEFGEALRGAQRSLSVGPADMLVLRTTTTEVVEEIPDVPKNATIVFDGSDRDASDTVLVASDSVASEDAVPEDATEPDSPTTDPPTTDPPTPVAPAVPLAPSTPEPEQSRSPASAAVATPPAALTASPGSSSSSVRTGSGWVAVAVAGLVLVLLIGSGVFFLSRGEGDPDVISGSDADGPLTSSDVEPLITTRVDATTTTTTTPTTTSPTTVPPPPALVLPPGDPVQIQMLNPRIESEVLEGLVSGFESEHPDISVEIVEVGGYSTSLDAVLSGEQEPDVALLAEKSVQSMLDQVDYVPVRDFIDRDDFDGSLLLANAADMYSTPEGLAAMPYNIAMPMMYANGDVLESAGVRLAPAAELSTEGLLDRCGQLSEVVPTCLEFRLSRFLFTEMVTNSGGRLFDTDGFEGSATSAAFDDGVGRGVFSFLVDPVRAGDAAPVGQERLFDEGETAFILDTSSDLGSIDRANQATDDPAELIALGVPHLDGVDPTGVVPGGGALWILDRGDERRAIASWLLVDYLSQLPQLLTYHMASGYVPARSDAAQDEGFLEFWSDKPVFRGAYDELVIASAQVLPNERDGRAGPYHQVDGAVSTRIGQAQSGELETDEAFDALVVDVNTLLAQYSDASG